ncbi:MAG: hypothetical protein Q4D38_00060 [Planctomycetia bacterium]|nr:hypothetical protein [Planctomycetia bacterium]
MKFSASQNTDYRDEELNARLINTFELAGKGDPTERVKLASVEEVTRTKLYEDSWAAKILPPETITKEELAVHPSERKPFVVVPVEPNSTGAITVQFGTVPSTIMMDQKQYCVYFNRIITRMYTMDVAELLTYRYDVRQILLDQQTKHIENEIDRRFLQAVDEGIRVSDFLGSMGIGIKTAPQWRSFEQGMTRENLVESTAIMSSLPNHLNPSVALTNTHTWLQLAKWGHDETGDTMAGDIIRNGMTDHRRMGIDFIVSIKSELIPNGTVYYFAEPKYIGRHFILEPLTLYVKSEAFMTSWFQYQSSGIGIGNLGGLARADFNPSGLSASGDPVTVVPAT